MSKQSSRIEEATHTAKAILADFERGSNIVDIARKCEHLGRLLGDEFILAYVDNCMGWDGGKNLQSMFDQLQKAGPTDTASGKVQFLQDFKLEGPFVPRFLARKTARANFKFLVYSLPAADTFVRNARKKTGYKVAEQDFLRSVEEAEAVLTRVATRLNRYASTTYLRLRFGNIPESILEATRQKVDRQLAAKCPSAVEAFAVAYEELQRDSPENWSNACLGVRRILLDFADSVYPAREEEVDGHPVGPNDYVNRIWAYASEHLSLGVEGILLLSELRDLGKRVDAIYLLASKGVHNTVTKDQADRIVIRTYLLLADLL